MKNWALVATFFCLWISTQLPAVFQDYLAYGLILSFGVLHGANDIVLITHNNNRIKTAQALLPYLLVILLSTLIFLVSKAFILFAFILISGYHFGEQHFQGSLKGSTPWRFPLYIGYGLSILFMIFIFNVSDVQSIIGEISGLMLGYSFFLWGLAISLLIFTVALFYLLFSKQLQVQWVQELFLLVLFLVVFNIASLLWSFAIFFILWHSIPSMADQMKVLYGSTTSRDILSYVKSSWVYWAISIGGLLLMYYLLKDQFDYFISLILYVLAAITFPHVIVMSRLEKH